MFPTQTLFSVFDQRPGLGDLLFADTFDQPDLWNTATSSLASASVSRNQLNMSISGQGPTNDCQSAQPANPWRFLR